MDPLTALILGGGSLLGGALSGGGGPDAGLAQFYGTSILDDRRKMMNSLFSQAGGLVAQKGAAGIQAAKEARRSVDAQGRGARRDILDNQQRMSSGVASDLQGRGLSNTTVGANLQRGVASDTSRQLSQLDSALAGLYADLDLQEGAARQQMFGEQADLALQRYSAESGDYFDVMLQLFSGTGGGLNIPTSGSSFGDPLDLSGIGTALSDKPFGGLFL